MPGKYVVSVNIVMLNAMQTMPRNAAPSRRRRLCRGGTIPSARAEPTSSSHARVGAR